MGKFCMVSLEFRAYLFTTLEALFADFEKDIREALKK